MNTPVNFEIAKLLKEKGFDGIMKEHYTKDKLVISDIISKYNWNKFTDMSGDSNYCSAPTIAEVVMWLYEKHGIWIYAKEEAENIWLYFYDNGVGYSSSDKSYTSPTEAYQEAIIYCLNELI